MYRRFARTVRELDDRRETGRTYRGCAHVSASRVDAQRAAINSVSQRSYSQSRREVVEHHHGTT